MKKSNWITLWKIIRSKENMKGWYWKEIDGIYYYTFDQAIITAQEQGLIIPTLQDFLDSGFTKERSEDNKKLTDKLWLTLDGFCFSDGSLNNKGTFGYVWSSSENNDDSAWNFKFNEDEGRLIRDNRYDAIPVRCIEKVESSYNSSLWNFDYLRERAERNNITVKARNELKVLLSKN